MYFSVLVVITECELVLKRCSMHLNRDYIELTKRNPCTIGYDTCCFVFTYAPFTMNFPFVCMHEPSDTAYHKSCMHKPSDTAYHESCMHESTRLSCQNLCMHMPRRRHFDRCILSRNNLCAIGYGAYIRGHMQQSFT